MQRTLSILLKVIEPAKGELEFDLLLTLASSHWVDVLAKRHGDPASATAACGGGMGQGGTDWMELLAQYGMNLKTRVCD